jgi:hypothetical protein
MLSLRIHGVGIGSCSVSAATGYRSELSQAQEAPRVSTHSAILTAKHGFLKGIPMKKSKITPYGEKRILVGLKKKVRRGC